MSAPVMVVSASVVTAERAHATRAAEVLAQAVAVLVAEGIPVSMSMAVPGEDDD